MGNRETSNRISSENIFVDLQARLTSGELSPGTNLKLSDLQRRYRCSSGPIRDVLFRLCNQGLVEFRLQRGFRATPTSPERRNEVTRLRALLEVEGAIESMRRGGIRWETEIVAAHQKFAHIGVQQKFSCESDAFHKLWVSSEREFHETLISQCGSTLLKEIWGQLYSHFRQQCITLHRVHGPDLFEEILSEHQAIVDSAISRDEEVCRAAIFRHFERNIALPECAPK